MKVLLIGKNPNSNEIASFFSSRGDVVSEDSSMNIVGLSGCIGGFTSMHKNYSSEVDILVLTELPQTPIVDIAGGKVHSVFCEDKLALIPKKERLEPIVFLLDYFDESFLSAHITALTDAKMLAGQKRKVFYLSKFVRTAYQGGEKLYQEARNAGVAFVKYEELQINYNSDNDNFTINLSDGVFEKEIITSTVFSDDLHNVCEDFTHATKVLRLETDEKGYINETKHFLTPVLTSRKGVYHISRDLLMTGLDDALNAIVSDAYAIEAEFADVPLGEKNTVNVDGEKCVFCYSCYRACPHAAMEADENTRAMKNLTKACSSCGTCVSVCPANALTLSLGEEISTNAKDGKILVMCCENSAEIAMNEILPSMGSYGELIEIQSFSCGGSMGLENLTHALISYDKVVVAVCMDDACKHFDGNKRACAQKNRLLEMLEKSGLDAGRIGFIQVSPVMAGVLKDELTEFIEGRCLS